MRLFRMDSSSSWQALVVPLSAQVVTIFCIQLLNTRFHSGRIFIKRRTVPPTFNSNQLWRRLESSCISQVIILHHHTNTPKISYHALTTSYCWSQNIIMVPVDGVANLKSPLRCIHISFKTPQRKSSLNLGDEQIKWNGCRNVFNLHANDSNCINRTKSNLLGESIHVDHFA